MPILKAPFFVGALCSPLRHCVCHKKNAFFVSVALCLKNEISTFYYNQSGNGQQSNGCTHAREHFF